LSEETVFNTLDDPVKFRALLVEFVVAVGLPMLRMISRSFWIPQDKIRPVLCLEV